MWLLCCVPRLLRHKDSQVGQGRRDFCVPVRPAGLLGKARWPVRLGPALAWGV